jgi:hypothetical protein
MATYHQYSEIVAAYGYRLPPPPPPQASRVGLALLYAAVGVALGTFTGTALAVATLPPEASLMGNHFTFAKSISSDFKIHSIANAGQAPVIQNHASSSQSDSSSSGAPAQAVLSQTANSSPAPALLIHQSPVIENHATSQLLSAAPAPAALNHASNSSSLPAPTLLIHQPPVFVNHAASQVASAAPAPVIFNHTASPSANSTANPAANPTANIAQPQILNLAPVVFPPSAIHTRPAHSSISANSAAPVQVASFEPMHVAVQPAPNQSSNLTPKQASNPVSTGNAMIATANLATPIHPQPPAAPVAESISGAALPTGLDGGFKPLNFYSEGDATVVGYNAADGTIQTDDGRTFVVGETVSASNAITWQDFRSNVHYRCDQNGNCSLVRTGVIALNAKLL